MTGTVELARSPQSNLCACESGGGTVVDCLLVLPPGIEGKSNVNSMHCKRRLTATCPQRQTTSTPAPPSPARPGCCASQMPTRSCTPPLPGLWSRTRRGWCQHSSSLQLQLSHWGCLPGCTSGLQVAANPPWRQSSPSSGCLTTGDEQEGGLRKQIGSI